MTIVNGISFKKRLLFGKIGIKIKLPLKHFMVEA